MTGQVLEEVRALERVHHRALHLGQVERDPRTPQPIADRLQALQGAGVDHVDGRAHQDDVLELRPGGNHVVDAVLEEARVGEVEALVDPHAEHPGEIATLCRSTLRKCSVPDLADDRHVRAAGPPQEQGDRHGHAGHHAGLHAR